MIRLLEATLVRVGNEEYARANKSYGLTTLRDRHAQFTSDGLELVFKGKHGIAASVHVQDTRRVVRPVRLVRARVLLVADAHERRFEQSDHGCHDLLARDAGPPRSVAACLRMSGRTSPKS